jgi:hypothetical protein
MQSRNTMMVVICVLALVAAGSLAAYYNERTQTPGVEIRVDKNGLQIQQR